VYQILKYRLSFFAEKLIVKDIFLSTFAENFSFMGLILVCLRKTLKVFTVKNNK
jgi:hypothetical protein